ncbi:hypothetical protein [Aquincola tertiaricarbonis]|uniref:hypothetical protein n=1 Tax=Aquincola tertiaricarbonis TaxID=391953 RepID=UPI0012EDE1C3|nr:hypothetical protein [Aquincola tertiaricarbonis]
MEQTNTMKLGRNDQVASELVARLGRQILSDAFYLAEAWDRLALVIELDVRKRMYGYIYRGDDWEAASPDGMEPLKTALALQQAMRLPGKAPWKKCLVRITRPAAIIDVDFEYGGGVWEPVTSDPATLALALKPADRR